MLRIIEKIDSIMTKVIEYIAVIAFIGVAFNVAFGIVARMIRFSAPWTEELARYSLIWFVFTAALSGWQYIENTCVDILFKRIPMAYQKNIRNIYRIVMILFLLLVMRYGIDYAVLGLKKRMVTIPLSIFWVRIAIPFGCAFMSLKWFFLIILSYSGINDNLSVQKTAK